MPAGPFFSVVIPAHNEEELLPRLLESIGVAAKNYRGGAESVEVIVGNNGSTDRTAEIARSKGCQVISVEKRVIAAARNGAARAAAGSVICFIDADSILHPQTFNEIDTTIGAGFCAVGASGVRMERMSAGIGATWLIFLPLTRLLAIDTGVVFCRREDFIAVGGYREGLLVAEDVDFMWRLKQLGRRRNARFRRLPSARAITSTRKFDRHGDWHYFPMVLRLFFLGMFSRAGARGKIWNYWYDRR